MTASSSSSRVWIAGVGMTTFGVHNALALCSARGGDVVDTAEDDWNLAMTVNLTSAFLAMKHVRATDASLRATPRGS